MTLTFYLYINYAMFGFSNSFNPRFDQTPRKYSILKTTLFVVGLIETHIMSKISFKHFLLSDREIKYITQCNRFSKSGIAVKHFLLSDQKYEM